MSELLCGQLSYDIVGAAIEVYNSIGSFYDEPSYQKAMEIELNFLGIPYVAKRRFEIEHRGFQIGWAEPDLLVDDSIVVELKALSSIHPRHVSQVLKYLALAERPLGLIINFGNIEKLETKRVPFSRSLRRLRDRRLCWSEESVEPDGAESPDDPTHPQDHGS